MIAEQLQKQSGRAEMHIFQGQPGKNINFYPACGSVTGERREQEKMLAQLLTKAETRIMRREDGMAGFHDTEQHTSYTYFPPSILYGQPLVYALGPTDVMIPLHDHTDVAHFGSPLQLVSKRASWWDLISCPRIHLQDSTGFSCHHSGLSLSPCSQDCCPKNSLPSQTLATDLLTLGKASMVPTKRHCCSPSVPENFFHWHPLCRPLGSKVWTSIKHRGSSGEGALEEQPPIPDHGACSLRFDQAPVASLQCVQGGGGNSPPFFSLALSRESLVSMLWESEKTLQPFPLQRRFSLSPVRFLPSLQSSASSTPELLRHQHGLPHSQSQPCDLDTKKNDLMRCHDEDAKWHRPSLNFYKMNQKQFSGGGLCFLDKSEEGSVPSWFLACNPQAPSAPCSPISSYGQVLSEEEEDEARNRSWHLGSQRTFFQQDFSDLDLNLIEEN